jgi:tripartite-type tricarboxylate transporter receptor subunit TctC
MSLKMKRNVWVLFSVLIFVVMMNPSNGSCKEGWPSKTISLISAYSPGGVVSTTLRAFAPNLQARLKTPVIVEVRTGAAGRVGNTYVYNGEPTGYTLLGSNFQDLAIGDVVHGAKYDTEKFSYVFGYIVEHYGIAVPDNSPFKTFEELYEASKKKELTAGNIGAGGGSHLCNIILEKEVGMKLTHVPFSGGGRAKVAVMGGHVDYGMVGLPPLRPLVKSGKVRILAIMGTERDKSLPDVPVITELVDVKPPSPWIIGVAAPPNTPEKIRQALENAFQDVCSSQEFNIWANKINLKVTPLNSRELRKITLQHKELAEKYKDYLKPKE